MCVPGTIALVSGQGCMCMLVYRPPPAPSQHRPRRWQRKINPHPAKFAWDLARAGHNNMWRYGLSGLMHSVAIASQVSCVDRGCSLQLVHAIRSWARQSWQPLPREPLPHGAAHAVICIGPLALLSSSCLLLRLSWQLDAFGYREAAALVVAQ